MTNRKSHTPFRLVPKSTTLDDPWTADTHSIAEKMRLSEPTTKISIKIDPYYQRQNVAQWTSSFWRYKVYADVRGDSLGRGVKLWSCGQRQFSMMSLAIFGNFRDEECVSLLYNETQSVVSFQLPQNSWPWMTLSGYFALNSVFPLVWLAPTVRRSKNNCVKTNKDRRIKCQRRKSLTGILVSDSIRFLWIFARVL